LIIPRERLRNPRLSLEDGQGELAAALPMMLVEQLELKGPEEGYPDRRIERLDLTVAGGRPPVT
jgi:hypothetical protein